MSPNMYPNSSAPDRMTDASRDYSAMRVEGQFCAVCLDRIYTVTAWPEHCDLHLAAGEAIVVKAPGQPDKVVPA